MQNSNDNSDVPVSPSVYACRVPKRFFFFFEAAFKIKRGFLPAGWHKSEQQCTSEDEEGGGQSLQQPR